MAEQQRARILVHVQPGAARSEATGFKDGVLQVRVAAPPVKGRANSELIRLLSRLLEVSKSQLAIEKGITSRTKTIAVAGLAQDQAQRLLEEQ
jgi:uncharacterized protein